MNKLITSAVWTLSVPTSLLLWRYQQQVRNIGSDPTARVNHLISAHKVLQFTGQAIDQYDPTERANPIFIGVKPGRDSSFKDKLMEVTKTVTTADWIHANNNWLEPFLQSQSPTDEAIFYDKLSKSFNEKTVALVPKEHRQRMIHSLPKRKAQTGTVTRIYGTTTFCY